MSKTPASISPRAHRSWPSALRRSRIPESRCASPGSWRVAELIVAFDLPSGREALAMAERLSGLRWAKIGPVLFGREGPALIKEFTQRGIRVFLDLKWHDIPNIVASAVSAARDLGVSMTTVHCLGGRAMLTAAARAAAGGPDLAVVGVTVLTSHDAAELEGV